MRLMLPKITCFYIFCPQAVLAQLVEHLICNQAVSSSSLLDGSIDEQGFTGIFVNPCFFFLAIWA